MRRTKLTRLFSGMALLLGVVAGLALSGIPNASAEPTVETNSNPAQALTPEDGSAAVRMICSRSCKPCYTQAECGIDGGSCGVWRCL